MFIHKNLIEQSYILRRNNVLKGLALFFLGASAVLLFSSADLVLNPNISNSFVYLQKIFFSPSGTANTVATVSIDGTSGEITATKIKVTQICDAAGANCFTPAQMVTAINDIATINGRIIQLDARLTSLSGTVSRYHP